MDGATPLCFGASIAGPAHLRAGVPNQDRWAASAGQFGTIIVVSDGVGSRRLAGRGASAACTASIKAARAWHELGLTSTADLPRLIEESWLAEIAPESQDDCAATCLFALVSPDETAHIGALGDGLAIVRSAAGAVEWASGPRESGFTTDSAALGSGGGWSLKTRPWRSGDTIVLATDGVSDDLLPDRIGDFAQWLVESFAGLDPIPRLDAMRSELAAWPTPRHLDDKTLAVLWARP